MKQSMRWAMVFLGFMAAPARAAISVDALGIEDGVNINSFATNPDASTSAKAGIVLGVDAELPVSGNLYFQPELRFVQKGFNFAAGSGSQDRLDATGRADYLELPLLLKVKFDQLHPLSPFVYVGPAVALRVGETASATLGGVDTVVNGIAFNPWDFSALVGLGADYQFSPTLRGVLQAEYSYGFSNASSETRLDWKSRGVIVTAGLMFPI
jgi:opacity protein-like surface antigen